MSIQNPICRSVYASAVGSRFGVGFGVSTLCRNLRRRSRRELCHRERQNRRSGRPVARAHRSVPGARAAALLLSNDADCLRALANVSASFDCNSPVLWPTTHCGRSWVPRWPAQEPRGGQRRKLSCERSSSAFPKMPAARPAPDRRPIPSLRSVIPQVGGQARFALKRSTASVALGSAPSSFARWDSLLLLSRPVRSALGRFLLLAPSRDGSSLSPALWGLRKLRSNTRKFLLHSLRLLVQPTLCHTARAAALARIPRRVLLQARGSRLNHRQSLFQSTAKHSSIQTKEQISHHASHRISTTRKRRFSFLDSARGNRKRGKILCPIPQGNSPIGCFKHHQRMCSQDLETGYRVSNLEV